MNQIKSTSNNNYIKKLIFITKFLDSHMREWAVVFYFHDHSD